MIQSVKLNELKKPAEGKIRIFVICCYAEKLLSPSHKRKKVAASDLFAHKNTTVVVDF